MKVVLEIELDLARPVTDDVFEVWAWALERQLEELSLVNKAAVIDATFSE